MSTTEHKKMLDATYGLKNIMGRHFLAIEQAYRDGKATAWATSGCPVEILYAMDVQPILPENSATISAAQKYSQNFIELAEAEGYSNPRWRSCVIRFQQWSSIQGSSPAECLHPCKV